MKEISYYLLILKHKKTPVKVCFDAENIAFPDGKVIELKRKINIHQFRGWCNHQNNIHKGTFPEVIVHECSELQIEKLRMTG